MILFFLLITFLFHGPSTWENQMQQLMFMKNMFMTAGLIYVKAFGAGDGWSCSKKKQEQIAAL
jgi:uncharacterized membrane protein YphA (DoxX/SURF4 family)